MSDAVFDATVVTLANSELTARRPGNALDRRLRLLESALHGRLRVRYNGRLLYEYTQHVRERRNDVVDLFFTVLDSPTAVRVARSTLSRQHHGLATGQRWPDHDQHLLAAALGGERPQIYVTESRLANCACGIHRIFRIRVTRV
jgi:hypothetical protein